MRLVSCTPSAQFAQWGREHDGRSGLDSAKPQKAAGLALRRIVSAANLMALKQTST
jgi:hypothetical protein